MHDRETFRRIIRASQLPIAIFGEWVMGVDRTTAQRYLHDGEMPATKRLWLQHIESVTHNGSLVTIEMRWAPPNRRWWPYVETVPHSFMAEERGLTTKDYRRRS